MLFCHQQIFFRISSLGSDRAQDYEIVRPDLGANCFYTSRQRVNKYKITNSKDKYLEICSK